jgi:hypothetical protein
MENVSDIKAQSMVQQIVIEWNYEPKDYFESRIVIEYDRFEIVVDSGHAEARIGPEYLDKIDNLINELSEDLESRFLAVQVLIHVPYTLSKPSRYDLRKDGKKNMYLQIESIVSTLSFGTVDLVTHDINGNVVSDSKQERIDKKKWFSALVAKFRPKDQVLDQMLRSYSASVFDPKNELIHLYEILDSVKTRFRKKGKKTLNITNGEWNLLGRLANDVPLKQGRHRGENPGSLRDATGYELEQARKIAAKIVEHYVIYLEKGSST